MVILFFLFLLSVPWVMRLRVPDMDLNGTINVSVKVIQLIYLDFSCERLD